ncbi:MAG: tetratricopeptide repeat protein [Planctomycetes bacterium]|nr:tetratricopeptide repeat protein [Planctomycetota bacterium]
MSRKRNKGERSRPKRLLLIALPIAIVLGVVGYNLSRNSARTLANIRELGRRDPAAAREVLEASNIRSRDAQLLRCQFLATAGNWKQAEDAFEEISQPEFCRQNELIELASTALASGIYSLADKVLSAAYRGDSEDVQLLRTMIDVKHELAAGQEVIELCREMSRLAPRDPYPWLRAAQIYQQAEKIDLAIEAYQEVLARDPEDRIAQNARFQIADLAIYAGELNTARQQLDQLLREMPDAPGVGVLYAKLLHREGDSAAGVRILNGVLASTPDFLSALLERGVLYLELEDSAAAVRDLDQVVKLDPENYTGHYQLGLAYQRLNQPDLAGRHFERSRQITEQVSEQKLQHQRNSPSSASAQ